MVYHLVTMGNNGSQHDGDGFDPRYSIEKHGKGSTSANRLQYHGVQYPKGNKTYINSITNVILTY